MGQIQDLSNQFRVALLNREALAVVRLTRAYRPVLQRLDREIGALEDKMREALQRGETIRPVWLFQRDRFDALRRATMAEVSAYSPKAQAEAEKAQEFALKRVNGDSDKLLKAALPPPTGRPDVAVNFARLGDDALTSFLGRASDGSPLRDLFGRLAGDLAENFQTNLVVGLATGQNPILVARGLRGQYQIPLQRARLIARTEMLTAYREATRERYIENQSVIKGWTWVSVLARSTCPACWIMHGTKHSVDERLDGHPNCRCVMVPFTKSWEELGFEGIKDTRPVVPQGEDVFRAKPEAFQQAVLGPKAFQQWKAGDLRFTDLLGRKDDPRWGTMRYTRSVRQVERGTGGIQVGQIAKGAGID
jgi:SPP1 gp7 family putative phage head morphogenesis protein